MDQPGVRVIVLGMHRSGTSLASGLLSHAGVYFGDADDFITANEENPKGFWERRDVRALNDMLLHSVGCDWSEISRFPGSTFPADVLASFEAEASAIITNLKADSASGVIGLKEPRLCLLLPQWLRALTEPVFYVLVHRDPREIAVSLQNRNGIPVEVAHYLTEHYLGRAIQSARRGPHQVVSFRELIDRPVETLKSLVERLNALGCDLEISDESEVRDFSTPTLHRSTVPEASLPLSGRLRDWCDVLQTGELPDISFGEGQAPAAVLAYEHSKRFEEYRKVERRQAGLSNEVAKLSQELARQVEQEAAAKSEREQLRCETQDALYRLLMADLRSAALQSERYELKNALAQANQQISTVQDSLIRQAREIAKLEEHLKTSQQQLLDSRKQSMKLYEQSRTLLGITQNLADRLEGLKSSLSWRIFKPLLAFALDPKKLGTGPGTLRDIETLLTQFSAWVQTAQWDRPDELRPPAEPHLQPAGPRGTYSPMSATAQSHEPGPDPSENLFQKLQSGNCRVGFAVTESDETAGAGDPYTASELASALNAAFGWECVLLGRNDEAGDWYDVAGLDCLIVLLESYDLSRIRPANGMPLKIAWIRNWTDQWVAKPWFGRYDAVLCSSEIASEYIEERTGKQAYVFRIATNSDRFNSGIRPRAELQSDYCFTGNFWGAGRKIEGLSPAEIPHDFALFGRGWEAHEQFAASRRGFVPYEKIPAVYRSTKILIDDANHVTAPWGSVNSRVFDALACGTLVLSNGVRGAREVFGDLLPTWSTMDDLRKQVIHYLNHPEQRHRLAQRLQQMVLKDHTYAKRAAQLRDILVSGLKVKARVSIKLPIASIESARREDAFMLGKGLARELRALGYAVRLDFLGDRHEDRPEKDNAVISLCRASEHRSRPGESSILWITRFPGEIETAEYDHYDRILVASHAFATQLAARTTTPIVTFPLCTDPHRFPFRPSASRARMVVYSGNAQRELCALLKGAIEEELDLTVIGSGWDRLVEESMIEGDYLEDTGLAQIYASSGAVLCGHDSESLAHGFMNRRVLDILASGGVPLTDDVSGIKSLLGDLVHVYDGSHGGVRQVLEEAAAVNTTSGEYKARIGAFVNAYSFRARAAKLDWIISELLGLELGAPEDNQ